MGLPRAACFLCGSVSGLYLCCTMRADAMKTAEKAPKKGLKYYRQVVKERGFKALMKEAGWKVALIVFLFFLGKGLLWLTIPYLVAKGIWAD